MASRKTMILAPHASPTAHQVQRSLLQVLAICALALLGSGCGRDAPAPGPHYASRENVPAVANYHFAVHPLHNPERLNQAYQPLMDYLSARLPGSHFELEASRDYGNYEAKFRARQPEFLLPNPWQTLEAERVGYRVIAMAGDPADFKGIFVVRRDGGIREPRDLKGKAVSYPSPTALAACIMPQYFLHQQGIDVMRDIDNRYVGSQESSIMNVYLGQSAAGATWPPPWRKFQKEHPQEAAQLTVAWETPSLVNNSVMARDDVPQPLAEKVTDLLATLHETAEGRAILAGMETARFHRASSADYQPVRDYVARFEKEVRPVESR